MAARIVYLDQCAISSIVKNKDDLWGLLDDKLRLRLDRGVVVCPASQLHYEESMLSEDWRDELWAKCQELAGPWSFLPIETIEGIQLRRGLRVYLGEPEEAESPQGVIKRSGGGAGASEPLASSVRQRKERSFQEMQGMVEDYQGFESARAACILRYVGQIPFGGGEGEARAVHLIEELAGEVHRLRPGEHDPASVIQEFLKTQAVQPVPFLDIWSRLWATIAQHVRSTVKPRRLKPGDLYDVQAMSFYGPYCDAMFVDNEFRKLASQRNVDVLGRYGVRLFSETNRNEFEAWLDETLAGITAQEHRPGLRQL